MATKTARPAARPSLFARAADKSADRPKKRKKGTVLALPKDLDGEGQLQGESKLLHEAVTTAIKAKRDMDAAKGLLGSAVGTLHEHAEEAWCAQYAVGGVQPETPVVIQNHLGESLTFVVQDKCGQNAVTEEQVELLGVLLGVEAAASLIETREVYGFNPDTMGQTAEGDKANGEESVQDVIFKIVSDTIGKSPKLSDGQKAEIFTHVSKTYVKKNTLPRLAELCGSNVGKIAGFLQAAGSAIVRYCKV